MSGFGKQITPETAALAAEEAVLAASEGYGSVAKAQRALNAFKHLVNSESREKVSRVDETRLASLRQKIINFETAIALMEDTSNMFDDLLAEADMMPLPVVVSALDAAKEMAQTAVDNYLVGRGTMEAAMTAAHNFRKMREKEERAGATDLAAYAKLQTSMMQEIVARTEALKRQNRPGVAVPGHFRYPLRGKRQNLATVDNGGTPVYAAIINIDTAAEETTLAPKTQIVVNAADFAELSAHINMFIRTGKCRNILIDYGIRELAQSNVVIVVKDISTGILQGILLGKQSEDEKSLYISLVCASSDAPRNVGKVALLGAIRYAADNDLDVKLHAVSDVIPYYAKEGFQLRKSCSAGEKVLPLDPAVSDDLRSNRATTAAKRFLAKTVPAGLDPYYACSEALYEDFDVTDDAKADAAVLTYKNTRCGDSGITMHLCQNRSRDPFSQKKARK